MAEKSYQDLAPFGGITRIRFKGFVQDVSAVSAPPLFEYEFNVASTQVNAAQPSPNEDGGLRMANSKETLRRRYPLFSTLYSRCGDLTSPLLP
jgi:hypothetical protein